MQRCSAQGQILSPAAQLAHASLVRFAISMLSELRLDATGMRYKDS